MPVPIAILQQPVDKTRLHAVCFGRVVEREVSEIVRLDGPVKPVAQLLDNRRKDLGLSQFSSVTHREVLIELLEQSHEAGLFEMVIAGECLGNAVLLHHVERDAVGQRPLLVGTAIVQLNAAPKCRLVRPNNHIVRVRL